MSLLAIYPVITFVKFKHHVIISPPPIVRILIPSESQDPDQDIAQEKLQESIGIGACAAVVAVPPTPFD